MAMLERGKGAAAAPQPVQVNVYFQNIYVGTSGKHKHKVDEPRQGGRSKETASAVKELKNRESVGYSRGDSKLERGKVAAATPPAVHYNFYAQNIFVGGASGAPDQKQKHKEDKLRQAGGSKERTVAITESKSKEQTVAIKESKKKKQEGDRVVYKRGDCKVPSRVPKKE